MDRPMLLLCGITFNLLYSTQAKISDACHGSFIKQTTNILKCPRGQSICITGVRYYQWHIGDIECPHTINKPVYTRCCRHDVNKCAWPVGMDHVTKLQRECESTRFGDGRCELLSLSPQVARWPCYIDNIEFSTSSSVRSIHYTCVGLQGRCQGRKFPETRRYPKVIPKSAVTSVTSTQALVTSTASGKDGHKNRTYVQRESSPLSTPAVDIDTMRVTSRMMSHPQTNETDAGAIAGGIIGTILICLLIIGGLIFKRWFVRKKTVTAELGGEDVNNSDHSKGEFISPDGNSGHTGSIRSVWTVDSFDSFYTYKSDVSRPGSVHRASNDHEYSCLVRSRSVFNGGSNDTRLETNARARYDHVHGEPPQLSVFRHNDYDHITLPEGHYDSPKPRFVPSEPNTPAASGKKIVYDHLRRESINKGGPYDSKRYDLLERNWNE